MDNFNNNRNNATDTLHIFERLKKFVIEVTHKDIKYILESKIRNIQLMDAIDIAIKEKQTLPQKAYVDKENFVKINNKEV